MNKLKVIQLVPELNIGGVERGTKDLSKAFKYSEKLKCGNVNVNDMSCYWETHIPAGGASGTSSGYGRQGGRHTIQEMSDLKTITMDIE